MTPFHTDLVREYCQRPNTITVATTHENQEQRLPYFVFHGRWDRSLVPYCMGPGVYYVGELNLSILTLVEAATKI